MVSSPKHDPHIKKIPKGYKSIEDDKLYCIQYYLDAKSIGTIEDDFDYDMHVTYCDCENDDKATYDLENRFGTNAENDDMESLKLGDDRIANPLAISDVIINKNLLVRIPFCMWIMMRMLYVIVMLLSLFMMPLKIIMRGELMLIDISILSRFLSLC